ncbi:50S ribosomal protein L22 [Candidatus Woesearchaeota archaeon]|nr:50S ribosomal protein L22 [Candidatus Woesearchaeota archaeon]
MSYNYSMKDYSKENMARAIGISLPISFKQSVEICNYIRNKKLSRAKDVLNKAINQQKAIPFRRFNDNTGHKKGIGPGKYPKKASLEILKLIDSVEANAQFKGMSTANLVIKHINANIASRMLHSGRKRGRKFKRTNIEIVVEEKADVKKEYKRHKPRAKQND